MRERIKLREIMRIKKRVKQWEVKINKKVSLVNPDELVSKIKETKSKLVLMIGAGDIGEMINNVQRDLNQISIWVSGSYI